MTEVTQAIKERRTVRQFLEKPVPEDVLTQLLEAVQWSPSWANTQCWELVVVKDPAVKEKLQAQVASSNPAFRAVVEAPVVIALCGRLSRSGFYKGSQSTKFGDWFMFDLGLAAQSLSLAAHSLGLGSVIIGLFDHDKAAPVLKVPAGVELVALIPVGYPAKIPPAPKRRSLEEFTFREGF